MLDEMALILSTRILLGGVRVGDPGGSIGAGVWSSRDGSVGCWNMSANAASQGRLMADSASRLAIAIGQFNRGDYFECHETLEALWLAEAEPLRRLYQGILQVGVALYHQRRGNYRGAIRLLESGIGYLLTFEPHCLGIDVRAFVRAAIRCRDHLAAL